MLVDKTNGRLSVSPGLEFHPKLPLDEFRARPDFDLWKNTVHLGDLYEGFTRDVIDNEQRKLNVQVTFLMSQLIVVYLSYFLPGEKDARFRESNYPDADTRRYHFHDRLLRAALGEPPYRFSWGFAGLGTHADGFSMISMDYGFQMGATAPNQES